MLSRLPLITLLAAITLLSPVGTQADTFNIVDYGAKPNDDVDDTLAVLKALTACTASGGGIVVVPSGTFLISRQDAETPILPLSSNTTLCGEGSASVLKFVAAVQKSNFWRMIGNAKGEIRNITVRNLHLDGSNILTKYEKGVPEHNHGIFLSAPEGVIENVQIERLLVENFSGDCIAVGHGCRNITIRDVAMRNYLRQGIQMGGGSGARDYLVTGCHDLAGDFEAGGSTLHVEHARGLKNVQLIGNRCGQSILAGGVDGLLIRDNVVTGRLVGNGNLRTIVSGNVVRSRTDSKQSGPLVQFGYVDNFILSDNILMAEGPEQAGIYVWGTSKYNPEPSRSITISGNHITTNGQAVSLNGVDGATVADNRIVAPDGVQHVKVARAKNVQVDGSEVQ